jgi:uncharacterized protein
MIVVDNSALVAYVDAKDRDHRDVRRVFDAAPEAVTSPLAIAEFDFLIRSRVGDAAARSALRSVLDGGLQIAAISAADLRRAADVDEQHADLGVGVTDASLVVLAARYDTRDIATLDHRDFRALTPLQGGSFRLLPADL